MKAVALFGVFVIAKLLVLAGRPIQFSGWTPIAYFWQDLVVVLLFALLIALVRREWFGWIVYGAAVLYVTINVPVALVLSTPLTWQMLGATGGALSDSIKHHATPRSLAMISLVAVAGYAFPLLLRQVRLKHHRTLVISSLLIVLLGPHASSRVDTIGLDRNPIMALATTALPRIAAGTAEVQPDESWRTSPIEGRSESEDLSRWRGAAAGRNVVMVLLESAGAQYLQPYGAAHDPMPNLTELTASALVFESAYAVYPESIKGLFSVLCARYPAMDTETEDYGRIATPSLAATLKQAGYRTALFHSGRFMYLGMEAVVTNRGYEVLADAGAIGGQYESSFGVDEPPTVRRALEWIDSLDHKSNGGERFFLTYLPIAGHHPYYTPEPGPFPERAESDRYLNALHYADKALGTLLEGLRSRGLAENTLFVIFGDHGQAFGQHEGNFGHSLFLYEENIRVPYLIAAPGLIKEQARIRRPISVIDTAPSIYDLLGLDAPPGCQGRTALDGPPRMALFFADYSLSLMGLRDGCWKYIHELDTGRSRLFNLCRDPGEQKDVSPAHPERVAAYRTHVVGWSSAQKALVLASLSHQ
jgi:lipoteichoic acid synthase